MTGRPAFESVNPTIPVSAEDMNLIANSGLQRFSDKAAARAAISSPANGELVLLLDQSPPLHSYRSADDDYHPMVANFDDVHFPAWFSPTPTREAPRPALGSGLGWVDPIQPWGGEPPAVRLSRSFDDLGSLVLNTDNWSTTGEGTVWLPQSASDGDWIYLMRASDGALFRVRPDGTDQAPALAADPSSLGGATASQVQAFGWDYDASAMRVVAGPDGDTAALYEAPVSGTGAWTRTGPLTGLTAPLTGLCWHQGRMLGLEQRATVQGAPSGSSARLMNIPAGAGAASKIADVTIPTRLRFSFGYLVGMASHRGLLHILLAEHSNNLPAVEYRIPLLRMREIPTGWLTEIAATSVSDNTIGHAPSALCSCRVNAGDRGWRLWFGEQIANTGGRTGLRRFGFYHYGYEAPAAPWSI